MGAASFQDDRFIDRLSRSRGRRFLPASRATSESVVTNQLNTGATETTFKELSVTNGANI
ncbi:MAG: hypothetical protein DMF73_17910 [Acidobacteria bacterium]|nr:MAG: hypothetical protein DMF73_17910 [Acidobacteriota bacterium]